MRDLGNGYRQSENLCSRCFGNDPEYENDSDLYEICPDCGELWVQAPEFSIEYIGAFYQNAFTIGSNILRSILNDRDAYINAKRLNPKWSDLTLEMATFNNQALRMHSICKHTFGTTLQINDPADLGIPRVQIQENNLNLNQKVRIQEQHQACLTRWVESGWTDNDAKKQMFELMAVMLSWEGSN